jgi:hypothetical protein
MSWCRMYHEASRFVEDEQRFIFIENVKGNSFSLYIKRFRTRDDQQNSVTGFHLMAGFYHLAINRDVALFY